MAEEVIPSPEDIRALQVLQLALVAGLVMFWGTIGFLAQVVEVAPREGAAQTVVALSAAHVFVALSTWTASAFVPELGLKRRELPIMGRLRAATILRLALFEGAALLGAVVCLLAVQLGVARELPLVWLNGITSVAFLLVIAATFPTRERIERLAADLRQRDAL